MDEREALNRVLLNIFDGLRNHTVELFHNDRPTWPKCRPEHVGSGVAIEYCGRYFVITASHVILDYVEKRLRNADRLEEDYDEPADAYLTLNNIGFYHNGYFFTCKRVFYTTDPADNIDVAILLIDDEHAKDWSDSVKFITIDDILLKHQIEETTNYYICGYPNCWVYLEEDRRIVRKPFQHVTKGVNINPGIEIKYFPDFNFLIEYDKNKMIGGLSDDELHEFYPSGISGCGLWFRNSNGEFKLTGVMIEDKSMTEGYPLMMATRIDVAVDLLEEATKTLNSEGKTDMI